MKQMPAKTKKHHTCIGRERATSFTNDTTLAWRLCDDDLRLTPWTGTSHQQGQKCADLPRAHNQGGSRYRMLDPRSMGSSGLAKNIQENKNIFEHMYIFQNILSTSMSPEIEVIAYSRHVFGVSLRSHASGTCICGGSGRGLRRPGRGGSPGSAEARPSGPNDWDLDTIGQSRRTACCPGGLSPFPRPRLCGSSRHLAWNTPRSTECLTKIW